MGIIQTLIPILLSFALTAYVGNRLVQKWQQRSWLQQQRLLRGEKEIEELKKTIDELSILANARSYRARRLLRNLGRATEERMQEIRKEYDSTVAAWNDNLNSLQVRFTLYADYSFAQTLENRIQPLFADISETLELKLRISQNNPKFSSSERYTLENKLNILNGRIFNFSRDALRYLLDKQKLIYSGSKIEFTKGTMHSFSTWYLLKALLVSKQPPQTVLGTSSDISDPTVIRF